MKVIFSILIAALSCHLYAVTALEENPCYAQELICAKKPISEQTACRSTPSDACNEYMANKSPMASCKNVIAGECKGKTGEEMLNCIRKSSKASKPCKAAVTLSPVKCPPNPCPIDYGHTDANEIFKCHWEFNEKHPDCLARPPKSARP
jgi:hypothetical protein